MTTYSINTFTVAGGEDEYELSFAGVPPGYLDPAHVRYYIEDAVQGNDSRVFLTDTRVKINPVPTDGTIISFRRESSPETPMVDWVSGASVTESNLDTNTLQMLYIAQEASDRGTIDTSDAKTSEINAAVSAGLAEEYKDAAAVSAGLAEDSRISANSSAVDAGLSAEASASSAASISDLVTDISSNTVHRDVVTGNPHGVTKADVGLDSVPNLDTTNASNITVGTLPTSVLPSGIVTSVNGGTGIVSLTQDNIPDGSTYVRTINDFTDTAKAKLDFLTVSESMDLVNLRRGINVKDYGAMGDGITDDRDAILSAIAALAGRNGEVFFPTGIYNVSGTINMNEDGIVFRGEGEHASVIQCTFASGNIIEIGSYTSNVSNCRVTSMMITSTVAKTSGAGIKVMNAHSIKLDHLKLNANMYIGFQFEAGTFGSGQFLYYLEHFEVNSGLHGVLVGTDATVQPGVVQDLWISTGIIASTTDAGMIFKHVSGLYMRDVDVLDCNGGIAMVPGTDECVLAVWAYCIVADTCSRSGWIIEPLDTGLVAELILVSCWGASCQQDGMSFKAVSGTNIGAVTLTAPRCINNGYNGILLDGPGLKLIDIMNAQCLSNSTADSGVYHGLAVGANVNDFTIIGGSFRESMLFGTNLQGYGIFINVGTSTNFIISSCNCAGNVTGAIQDGSTGVDKAISSVIGYRTKNTGTTKIASGSATAVVAHGLSVTPSDNQLTILNLVNPDAAGLGSAHFWVNNVTTTTFTINSDVTATNDMWIGWTVDASGQ